MRFRQDDFEKRISDKTLLPLSVTYEDTYLEEGEEYEYFDITFYDRSTPELKKHKKEDDVFRYNGYVLTPGLAKAIKTVAPYAICNEPILIEGANGTGKETLAHAIHSNSGLSGPLVSVDCGSYSSADFERDLIGTRARPGLVERAKGGSLYLKDIEKLTLPMQEVLFHLLKPMMDLEDDDEGMEEEGYSSGIRGVVERTRDFVGSRLSGSNSEHNDDDEEENEIEIQIIATCSPSIRTLLTKKKFSRDLYRSLKEGYAVLPALREHTASIFPLFKLFVESAGSARSGSARRAKSSGKSDQYTYAKDVNTTLSRLKWPGNYDDLIRCATQVSLELTKQPGPITGTLIKLCLDLPSVSETVVVVNQSRKTAGKAKPAETVDLPSTRSEKSALIGSQLADQSEEGGLSSPESTEEERIIRPKAMAGPVIGITMSKAWQDQHEQRYNELKRAKHWKETNDEICAATKVKCDTMLQGTGHKLAKILADEWTGRFEKVLVARRILITMERHLPDLETRLQRLGWLDQPDEKEKDEQKRRKEYGGKLTKAQSSYKVYCHNLGFLQSKIGDVLSKSFLWPEERAWLNEYEPPR